MKRKPHLSVVMPAYNEEQNIKNGVLNTVFQYFEKQSYTWEIIIVDDGSTDQTRKLLKDIERKNKHVWLIEIDHQGKAGAVTAGVLAAKGKNILFTDLDQATPISEAEKLLSHLDTYEIAIGSRAGRRKGAPLSRLIMARGFMLLRQVILGIDVEDTQCGFKAFRREAAHELFKRMHLYKKQAVKTGSRVTAGFDVELLYLAKKMGYRIKEVPVVWRYVESRRVSPIRDSFEGLRDLLRIRLLDVRGAYE